ncbi:MAG: GNAT family N-acetyltransferase [Solirubrobacteraceae bacterium]|jgi:GNAT superfamily N-acetyltransferase
MPEASTDRGERAILRDGTEVLVRRVSPSDAPVIAEAFERLSAESRRLRFLSPKQSLNESELRYLTDVDGDHHEALVATDERSGKGVGIARFVRLEGEPDVAEVAVTVVDAWQARGLGTLLLERLSERAREVGITHFSALISSENKVMLDVLRRASAEVQTIEAGAGVAEYRTALPPAGLGAALHEALRSAASGELHIPRRLAQLLAALTPSGPRTPG